MRDLLHCLLVFLSCLQVIFLSLAFILSSLSFCTRFLLQHALVSILPISSSFEQESPFRRLLASLRMLDSGRENAATRRRCVCTSRPTPSLGPMTSSSCVVLPSPSFPKCLCEGHLPFAVAARPSRCHFAIEFFHDFVAHQLLESSLITVTSLPTHRTTPR